MELARKRIVLSSSSSKLHLYPIGDIHLGAAACDLADFRRLVQVVKDDPDGRWIGMGDYGDLIMPNDPRWAMDGHDWARLGYVNGRPSTKNLLIEHREFIKRELAPIADKCIGVLYGNHEQSPMRYFFVDVAQYLAEEFKVPYLGYTAMVRLEISIPRKGTRPALWTPVIFAEHGATGGGTAGNALNSIQKRAADFTADVYLKGHVHQFGVSKRTELAFGLDPHGVRIDKRDLVFMLTGTYLRGYAIGVNESTTYSERRGYPPSEIGGGVVIFNPKLRRISGMSVAAYQDASCE